MIFAETQLRLLKSRHLPIIVRTEVKQKVNGEGLPGFGGTRIVISRDQGYFWDWFQETRDISTNIQGAVESFSRSNGGKREIFKESRKHDSPILTPPPSSGGPRVSVVNMVEICHF